MTSPPSKVITVPQPDPTLLTTLQLHRELSGLRELLEARVRTCELAAEAMARDLIALREQCSKLTGMRSGDEEKMVGIDRRLAAYQDAMRLATDNAKHSLEIAIAGIKDQAGAQNASIIAMAAKSETASTKQIDALDTLMVNSGNALSEKIAALSTRIDRNDGQRAGRSDSTSFVFATIGAVAALGLMLMAMLAFWHNGNQGRPAEPPAYSQPPPPHP